MAGLFWVVDPGTQAIGSGVTLTLFQIVMPNNHRGHLHEISMSFNGVTAADPPIKMDVLVQTGGTFTNNNVATIKLLDSDPETPFSVYNWTTTGEPTPGNIKFSEYVHPQGGTWFWQPPPAIWPRGFPIQGGTRVGVRVIAGTMTGVTNLARCIGEE